MNKTKIRIVKDSEGNLALHWGTDNSFLPSMVRTGEISYKCHCAVKQYYDLFNLIQIPEYIRIALAGYAAIAPFWECLIDHLGVFPNLVLYGGPCSGKTSLLQLFFESIYGGKVMNPDEISTESRLITYSTANLLPIIDDIENISPSISTYLKNIKTHKISRVRDGCETTETLGPFVLAQTIVKENQSICIKKEPFSERHLCLVLPDSKSCNLTSKTHQFFNEFKRYGLFGIYLIEHMLLYFDYDYNVLIKYFLKRVSQIKEYLALHLDKRLLSSMSMREIRKYTLIYIGIELWNWVFIKKDLKSERLANYLDLNKQTFLKLIVIIEIQNK